MARQDEGHGHQPHPHGDRPGHGHQPIGRRRMPAPAGGGQSGFGGRRIPDVAHAAPMQILHRPPQETVDGEAPRVVVPVAKLDELYRMPVPKLFEILEKEGIQEHSPITI